jgi:ElaB/YqjD/DUF883 family membrane-anchored ribosome-binding protein
MTTSTTFKPSRPAEQADRLADHATQVADHAVKSTQRVATEALNGLADAAKDIRHEAAPLLNDAAGQVSALTQRGLDAVRSSARQLRDQAELASDSAVSYIKDEPVKAVLIAAATGAALMAMVSLISRSIRRV